MSRYRPAVSPCSSPLSHNLCYVRTTRFASPMADTLSPIVRSQLMGRIGGKNTKPEMAVRCLAHGLGYRFRLHRRDLPGTPDLVFPRKRIVLFVHGCFWHRHPGCRKASHPTTRVDFWLAKFARNVARDTANEQALRNAGWKVGIIWECETKSAELLIKRLESLLGPTA